MRTVCHSRVQAAVIVYRGGANISSYEVVEIAMMGLRTLIKRRFRPNTTPTMLMNNAWQWTGGSRSNDTIRVVKLPFQAGSHRAHVFRTGSTCLTQTVLDQECRDLSKVETMFGPSTAEPKWPAELTPKIIPKLTGIANTNTHDNT